MRDYPTYLNNIGQEEGKGLYRQVSAMIHEKGKLDEIYAFIKKHVNNFEEFVTNENLIGKTQIRNIYENTYNMGDVFLNIEDSTIVNKSSAVIALNKFNLKDKETSEALKSIAEFVDRKQNRAAGSLFNSFTDELNKPTPDKSHVKSFWEGIVTLLPDIISLTSAVYKITQLFN